MLGHRLRRWRNVKPALGQCILLVYSRFIPYLAKLFYLNFQQLEVVSRYRDPQPQVVENYSYLFNFRPNIYNY